MSTLDYFKPKYYVISTKFQGEIKKTLECPKCHFENPDKTEFCGNCASPLSSPHDTSVDRTETLNMQLLELKTGSTLAGRYEIIEELGKGGMGRVYKAFDKEINEKIALKLIRPEIAANKKIINRFQNELKIARKIAHRHVCRMYDLGKHEDIRFITMEYVSGEDLKKSLVRMGPLIVKKAVSIGKQICQGLSEAHRLGIIHRDLKPHNIMIDEEGNTRIMDFGISLFQTSEGITDSGVVVGTPKYFSPEQVEGKQLDQRSDIYAFGIILYEMVTGHVPFEGDTALVIAHKHLSESPRDPSEFNSQIPEQLSRLILKCIEKDPEKRYQTAEDVCAELTRIEDNMPTSETRVSKGMLRPKTSRRMLEASPKLFRFLRISLLCVLVLAAGYIFYDQVIKTKVSDTGASGETGWVNSVVVLPFEHIDPKEDQRNLYFLMTEEVIRRLNKFKELKVINPKTALSFKDSNKGASEIGRELKVDNVLWGTISTEVDDIIVNIWLSKVAGDHLIMSESFSGNLTGVFKLEDKIAKAAAAGLGLKRVGERYSKIAPKVSNNPEANEYYNAGRQIETDFYVSKKEEDFERSVQSYLKAVELDKNFSLPYWRLANLHEARYNMEDDENYLNQMYQYFQQAYEIDPDLAEANVGLGWKYFYREEQDRAYQFFKRAYELDANNADVNFHIGSFLRSIGLYEQAIRHYDRALQLDPVPADFSLWQRLRASCYSYTGKFKEAATYLEKALTLGPDLRLYLYYVRALIMLGRYEDAEVQISEAEKLSPDDVNVKHNRALLLAASGEKEKAVELIQGEDRTYLPIMTCIYALLGRKQDAIENIQTGIEVVFERHNWYPYSYPYLKNNPCYDSLRDDPRFQEIMIKEKAKYDEKVKKYGDL